MVTPFDGPQHCFEHDDARRYGPATRPLPDIPNCAAELSLKASQAIALTSHARKLTSAKELANSSLGNQATER